MAKLDPHEETRHVTKGTLRRVFRKERKTNRALQAVSFKTWVGENITVLMDRYEHRPAFSLPAGKLLGME